MTTSSAYRSARRTWPVAGGSLALGFAVASLSGVRPLGGAVLIAALAWSWTEWHRARGAMVAAGLTATYAALFALSHVIGDVVSTSGAVAFVTLTMAGVTWFVVDRHRPVGNDR